MKHLFVSYGIAKQLKEKGFDENLLYKCYYASNPESRLYDCNEIEYFENKLNAPLYQQVIDWFREKHDIIIGVDYKSFNSCGYIKTKSKTSSLYDSTWTNTDENIGVDYYQALNKAIDEALKLINENII